MSKQRDVPSDQWIIAICGSADDVSIYTAVLHEHIQNNEIDLMSVNKASILENYNWLIDNVVSESETMQVYGHSADDLSVRHEWDDFIEICSDIADEINLDFAYAKVGSTLDSYDFRPGEKLVIPYQLQLCTPLRLEVTGSEEQDESTTPETTSTTPDVTTAIV